MWVCVKGFFFWQGLHFRCWNSAACLNTLVNFMCPTTSRGFPESSVSKESTCNEGDPSLIPGSGRSSWRIEWPATPVFLPGNFQAWKNLVGYGPWSHKESDVTGEIAWSSLCSTLFQHSRFISKCLMLLSWKREGNYSASGTAGKWVAGYHCLLFIFIHI